MAKVSINGKVVHEVEGYVRQVIVSTEAGAVGNSAVDNSDVSISFEVEAVIVTPYSVNADTGEVENANSTLEQVLRDLHSELKGGQGAQQPIARDAGDRMRVVFDTLSTTNMPVYMYWGFLNTYPPYYSSGAPTSMDAREVQEEQSVIAFQQTRNDRWVVS